MTDPKAEKMLRNAIESAILFKSPEDYVLARDTSYWKSFNNVMNVFQHKTSRSVSTLTMCEHNLLRYIGTKTLIVNIHPILKQEVLEHLDENKG